MEIKEITIPIAKLKTTFRGAVIFG